MAATSVQGYQGVFIPDAPVTIAISQTKSAAIDMKGMCLVGIKLPAAFTGTALTFEMCDTVDGTYVAVKNTTSGTALSYTVAQGTYAAIDPKDFQGIRFLKIVSGSTEAAARTLTVALKGL